MCSLRFASSHAALKETAAVGELSDASTRSSEEAKAYLPYVNTDEKRVHVHWDAALTSRLHVLILALPSVLCLHAYLVFYFVTVIISGFATIVDVMSVSTR